MEILYLKEEEYCVNCNRNLENTKVFKLGEWSSGEYVCFECVAELNFEFQKAMIKHIKND